MSFAEIVSKQRIYQISTHPGKAHRDEFLSCCLLLGMAPGASVVRRKVTQADIDNPTIVVVDTGGIHDPEKACFDHHQFGLQEEPRCALTLVLDALELLPHARKVWPWLLPTEILDCYGVTAVARMMGIPRHEHDATGQWFAAASPLEKYMLQVFGDVVQIRRGHFLHELMVRCGQAMVQELREAEHRFRLLDQHAALYAVGANDPVWFLWVALPASAQPDKWLTGYSRSLDPVPDLLVLPYRFGVGSYIRFASKMPFTPRDLADTIGPDARSTSGGVIAPSLTIEKLQNAIVGLV
jgi:hypothetical protein